MPDEFEFINNIKSRYSLSKVGDDCAIVPKDADFDLLVSGDLLVEDIDFKLEWTTPELIGHKALAVSLSDIAAMGGEASWALLSIGISENLWKTDFLDRFYEGWHDLAAMVGIELIGGDISRVSDKLVIDSVVGGQVPKNKAILRSGAKPGDSIYVTGPLGGATAGLDLLQRGIYLHLTQNNDQKELILKQLQPTPRLDLAKFLLENNIPTAMIDLSDGLSSDLHHLTSASRVGARLYKESIPIHKAIGSSDASQDGFQQALHGGEDFELLFTANEKKISSDKMLPFYRIGEITSNEGMIELTDHEKTLPLPSNGYRHF